MTWRQRCEEIANQLPGGFEADTQMLEFLQVAINIGAVYLQKA